MSASKSNSVPGHSEAGERRDYIRVEDRIGLEFLSGRKNPDRPTDPANQAVHEALEAEWNRLDLAFRDQLPALAERNRSAATLFKVLNGKLDALARIMDFQQNPLQPEDCKEVTISEGGLAFTTTTSGLTLHDECLIRLTLLPEFFRPETTARVVSVSDNAPDNRQRVHLEFTNISDSARQMIAKHILRLQVRARQVHDSDEMD